MTAVAPKYAYRLATLSNCLVRVCANAMTANVTIASARLPSKIGLRRCGRNSPRSRLTTIATKITPSRIPRIAQAALVPGIESMIVPSNCFWIGGGALASSSKILSLKLEYQRKPWSA